MRVAVRPVRAESDGLESCARRAVRSTSSRATATLASEELAFSASRYALVMRLRAFALALLCCAVAWPRTSWSQSPAPASSTTTAAEAPRALETFDAAWSIIDQQYYDPTFNGVDWKAVRDELRPRAEKAADREALRAVIREMLGRLKQSHFALIPREILGTGAQGSEENPAGTCGLELRIIGDEFVVVGVKTGGPAASAGVAPGWALRAIDGSPVTGLEKEIPPGVVLRREVALWKLAYAAVDGPVGSRVELTLEDATGSERKVALERVARDAIPYTMPGLPTFFLERSWEIREHAGLSIGVLRFSNWFQPLLAPLDEAMLAMRDCDAIVLDLRGNTGGDASVMCAFAGHFFDQPVSLGTEHMRRGPVEFRVMPRSRAGSDESEPFLGPLVILTDAITGSSSEVFGGGMRSLDRAILIGERTAGAALPATLSPLPNGDSLMHAIAEVTNAHGDKLEGDGLRPDVELHPTRGDWTQGHDVVLEAALKWIAKDAGR